MNFAEPVELELPTSGVRVWLDPGGLWPRFRLSGPPGLGWPAGSLPLEDDLLLGARRAGRGRHGWSLAWGALPRGRGASGLEVVFSRARPVIGGRRVSGPVQVLGGRLWVSEVAGEFISVTVQAAGLVEQRDLRA